MGDPKRFAIIGCGKIAGRHAEQAARLGTLVAVCDIVKDKADTLARAYNAHSYASADALFLGEKEIDIVAVCTPNGLHPQHSIQALKAGSHVLCEKPLCIAATDAQLMMAAAKEAQRNLFVVKSTRYNPALMALKEKLVRQELGQLYSFQLNCFWNRPAAYYAGSWKGSLSEDGGTLYTQFSHYIDAILWLFGDMQSVSGWRKNLAHQSIIEFEDTGVAAMQMTNGIIGGLNWSVNTVQKNMEVSLTILSEKASIRIGGEYMNKVEYERTDGFTLGEAASGNANDYGFYKGSMSNHDKVYENMLLALDDHSHPFTHAIDGLKTVETIEKIYNCVSLS